MKNVMCLVRKFFFLILLTARVPQLVVALLARFAWMRERKSSAAFVGSKGASTNCVCDVDPVLRGTRKGYKYQAKG